VFRLNYTLQRERGPLESLTAGMAPDPTAAFRCSLNWQVEPIAPVRGESLEAALAATSEFRQVVDGLDPQQAVVTLWVYPDSFALYRRLRDYLYERGLEVAGRPLPEGVPIGCSRDGRRSRGQ
jgi:hypothetical protein